MKVWITQGEHFYVPGRATSIYATRELANKEASELVAVIRKDYIERWKDVFSAFQSVGLGHDDDKVPSFPEPTPGSWQLVLNAMQATENDLNDNEDDRYRMDDLVWITEHEVIGC